MAELQPISELPEAQAVVVSTECTHVAPGLPELPAGVPTAIPLASLAFALTLQGVLQVEPNPNPSFTLEDL